MMTTHHDRHYKAGGDPRTLADFMALRAEMNKLSHPARPDINWPYAEQLARALLEHHGADLQTVAWYTLARARLDGLAGINEGLTLMESLLVRQGKNLWPQALPARTEIFRTLSKRLRQVIRTLNLTPEDVESLEQAERSLQSFDAVLQRLEIAPENQLSDLRALAKRLKVQPDLARELWAILRRDVKTDWTVRDDVRAKLRSSVKRLLVKYKYPPDQQPEAIRLVIEQLESMAPRMAEEGAA